MTEQGGRWVFVTMSFPARSKEQRIEAAGFTRRLIDAGYVPLRSGAYLRYVPSRKRARAEASRLRKAFPERGSLHVVELSPASLARTFVLDDGELLETPKPPDLLTVY
jgi:CRISPR/Cas system-associated protein endoribonuclease Cas2